MISVEASASGLPMLAPDAIARAAGTWPRAAAVEMAGTSLDYGVLAEQAGVLAAALEQRGVGAGALVALCLPRSPAQIVAMLAAWRLGAAYLPVDPAWPEARLAALVAGAGCAALVADASLGGRIAGQVPLVAPDAAEEGTPVAHRPADPDSLAYVIYYVGFDRYAQGG